MLNEQKIYSSDITKALAKRHTEDFFMTEVKDGPTIFGSHLRLDAVAIAKKWTHPCITGYEVKISRSDWLSDNKWHAYTDMCHVFSVAAAAGVVKDGEIPDGIGLLEYSPASGTVRLKRKAAYRNIEINPNMLLYILMNRISSDHTPFYSDREAQLKDYLDGKKNSTQIGHLLARNISDRLYDAEQATKKLKRLEERYAEQDRAFKEIKLVLQPHVGYVSTDSIVNDIRKLISGEYSGKAMKTVQTIKSNIEQLELLLGQTKIQ